MTQTIQNIAFADTLREAKRAIAHLESFPSAPSDRGAISAAIDQLREGINLVEDAFPSRFVGPVDIGPVTADAALKTALERLMVGTDGFEAQLAELPAGPRAKAMAPAIVHAVRAVADVAVAVLLDAPVLVGTGERPRPQVA